MRIDILTLFPEMFTPLFSSIMGRAAEENIMDFRVTNIRDFSLNKHKKTDDYPFGGGAGMVMTCQPIYDAVQRIDPDHQARRIYLSPKGKTLNQSIVEQISSFDRLLLLCGHYEGIDQRVLDLCMDEEISVGDYVLTGGELPAMILCDAVARYVPSVLHSGESVIEESFSNGLLEYPQYTRPEVFMECAVPSVLLSGNHAKIREWREEKAIEETKLKRPDLLEK